MPSIRALSILLFASLTTFSLAAPAPALEARCDACDAAEAQPLPVICGSLHDKVSPLVDQLRTLSQVTPDTLNPICGSIKSAFADAQGQVQAYIDGGVGLDIGLAADASGGAAVSMDVFAGTLAGLVNLVFEGCKVAYNAAAEGHVEGCAQILADLCTGLASFVQVCCTFCGAGLAAGIYGQVGGFLEFCGTLGISGAVGFLTSAGVGGGISVGGGIGGGIGGGLGAILSGVLGHLGLAGGISGGAGVGVGVSGGVGGGVATGAGVDAGAGAENTGCDSCDAGDDASDSAGADANSPDSGSDAGDTSGANNGDYDGGDDSANEDSGSGCSECDASASGGVGAGASGGAGIGVGGGISAGAGISASFGGSGGLQAGAGGGLHVGL
ncbi:hypothetical protein V5O48_011437 [Marasmius crinis-equi]|uniref:Uncharacterized protein n=1 Tax=Marasmius crinis-equi TaxID=585013 RepID=A0ABR3F5L2_9AGAR